MNTRPEQLFTKTFFAIRSCKTPEQLASAERFYRLGYDMFKEGERVVIENYLETKKQIIGDNF